MYSYQRFFSGSVGCLSTKLTVHLLCRSLLISYNSSANPWCYLLSYWRPFQKVCAYTYVLKWFSYPFFPNGFRYYSMVPKKSILSWSVHMARAGAPFSSSGVGIRFFHHIYWRSYLAPCLWGIILSKLKEVNSRTRRESCTFSRHGSRSVQQRSRLTGHQHPSPYAFWLWIPHDLGYHVTGCLKLFLPWLSQHDGLSHGTLSPNKTLLLLSGYIVTQEN